MTQPPRRRVPANHGAQKKSRRMVGMVIGFLMAVLGSVLLLLNYSSNPVWTNIGIVLAPMGLIVMGVSAAMRDKLNGRQSR